MVMCLIRNWIKKDKEIAKLANYNFFLTEKWEVYKKKYLRGEFGYV